MAVQSYRDLIVWQKAMDLVEDAYQLTRKYPKEEIYCLTNQTRRSAISIPSNIAEGQGRHSTKEFLNFLSVANGSLRELETQILIGNRLHYLTKNESEQPLDLASEVARLLHGLRNSLNR